MSTNEQFVKDLYQDIFKRTYDQPGLDYWTNELDKGLGTRDSVRKSFARSDEAKEKISNLYQDLLKRDITQTGTDEFATNEAGETDASWWLNDLYEDNDGSYNNLERVEYNIKQSDEYKNLQASIGDTDASGVIEDDEIGGITDNTSTEIDSFIDNAVADNGGTDINDITNQTLTDLSADTGGVGLDDTNQDDSSNVSGTLDQTNNEAVQALDNTLDGGTADVASLDLTNVISQIDQVEGDLAALQSQFSGFGDIDFNSAGNIDAIKTVLADEGYLDSVSNVDSTYDQDISDLAIKLDHLTGDVLGNSIDVTDLTGKFNTDLDALKTELTGETDVKFGNIKTDYDKAIADLARVEGDLATQKTDAAAQLAAQKTAFDAKLNANMATQSNNFSNLSTNVNSKLNKFSKEQAAKFANVYKTREQAIGELQTEWGNRLQEQEAGLQERIQMTAENFNERLTNISKNMNYRMLGDSAAGIKMRRSKAFTSGRTAKGTGQMNRAMRIQSLNL
tara:strand:- start:2345 stop:3865 length:1521 start_codon:yes stop_codon:yes gene_type:complete